MLDHADPLKAEAAWLKLAKALAAGTSETQQIALYQQFAADYPSYADLCQTRIRHLAAALVLEGE